jgi:mevalonate kinase
MIEASAPGKVIILGEHSVVYGRPAIAVPLNDLRAKASINPIEGPHPADIRISAPQIQVDRWLCECDKEDPLALATRLSLERLKVSPPTPLQLELHSDIPISSGLGSGAAISVAITRSISEYFQQTLAPEEVSQIAFEVEKLHHGTPSGIDNTVVTFEQAVHYEQNAPTQIFKIPHEFKLVIADSGKPAPTATAVAKVRDGWKADRKRYEAIFDEIRALIDPGHRALLENQPKVLGRLMDENHRFLQEMGVSSEPLDRLVESAKEAGAIGAKLSGGGLGGVVIAIPGETGLESLVSAFHSAGAVQVYTTRFGG